MAGSEINIGAKVKSSDGKHLGDIDNLVVDGKTNRLAFLVIDKGIFSSGRLVDVGMIASSDEHGVVLTIGEEEAKQLPAYVVEEFVQFRDSVSFGTAMGTPMAVQGTGNDWILYGSGGGQYPHTGTSSLFMAAPMGNVVTEAVTSIPEEDISLSEGTRVVDSAGHTVGHIDEVLFDEERQISGFVVKAGHLFHHDVRVPYEWVAGMSHDHVRLNVTKEFAEGKGAAGASQS